MSWKVIREKGIKLKGMTRRVSAPEVVACLLPYESTLFLEKSGDGACVAFFRDGEAMDFIIEDDDLARACVAYLLELGLEVFDDLAAARASIEARTEPVLPRPLLGEA